MTSREPARRILERLLANGPLTALPKRPGDQHLLALLAATRFAPGETYLEAEVNARLVAWLETISVPHGIDHVTMRRLLVDSRLLTRTASGSSYHLDAAKSVEIDAARALDPAAVLATIADERDRRKRQHAA
jgi:hypothetical protein